MPGKTYNANVNINFEANTRKLVKDFQSLEDTITRAFSNVSKMGTKTNPYTATRLELEKAVQVSVQLRQNLQNAFNTKTGRLDFTEFTKGMQNAGLTIQNYINSLNQLGPKGQAAFNQFGQAILNSELQLKRTHPILNKFIDSIGRVALWQMSTRALSLMTSSFSDAYQFAQDLNRSLNDIRIVTKASADDMANFAIKANAAAQALSSTTTAYTDASLIYFQQGLSEQETIERTNVTLKMANVTGESVKTISNDLTAIWNNFDDGSKNLEYYADVMTKLGATTASSSREIATGLEKFAPIAKTVGLSYEYAASALATVSAETRASADVVGTAFKTIFARLESLKLGETLEDGVGLTKYTSAVQAVGVSVMDTNGEMRKLDDILKDIGAKWQDLDSAQKSALANTVAGVRQYSQFMALMENWDKVEMNVDVSLGSEGELQEQQEIYAQSWQAASRRVKDSLQSIYMDLLDDQFFVEFLNGANEFVKVLGTIVKTLGGIPGILSTILNLYLTIKQNVIANNIGNALQNMFLSSKRGIAFQKNQQSQVFAAMEQRDRNELDFYGIEPEKDDYLTKAITTRTELYKEQIQLQEKLASKKRELTDTEREILQILKDQAIASADSVKTATKARAKAQDNLDFRINNGLYRKDTDATGSLNDLKANIFQQLNNINDYNSGKQFTEQLMGQYTTSGALGEGPVADIIQRKLKEKIDNINKAFDKAIEKAKDDSVNGQEIYEKAEQKFINQIKALQKDISIAVNGAIQSSKEPTDPALKNQANNFAKNRMTINAGNNLINKDLKFLTGSNIVDAKEVQANLAIIKQSFEEVYGSELSQLSEKARQSLQKIFASQDQTELKVNVESLKENLKALNLDGEETKRTLDQLFQGDPGGAEKFNQEVGIAGDKAEVLRQKIMDLVLHSKNAKGAMDDIGNLKGFQKLGQDITKASRGLAGIGQAINTVRGLFTTLGDKDTSGLDKMVAIFTALPSLIFATTSAISMFNIEEARTAYQAKITALNEGIDAVAKTGVGNAALGAVPKIKAFGAALKVAMGPIGLIVTALGALVTVFLLVNDSMKNAGGVSVTETFKNLNDNVKEATDSFNKLRNASDNFINTFDSYDKAITKMDLLVEGTREYAEALEEARAINDTAFESEEAQAALQYVLSHLDKYKDINSAQIIDKRTGSYAKEVYAAVKEKMYSDTVKAQAAVVTAQRKTISEEIVQKTTNPLLELQQNGLPELSQNLAEAYIKAFNTAVEKSETNKFVDEEGNWTDLFSNFMQEVTKLTGNDDFLLSKSGLSIPQAMAYASYLNSTRQKYLSRNPDGTFSLTHVDSADFSDLIQSLHMDVSTEERLLESVINAFAKGGPSQEEINGLNNRLNYTLYQSPQLATYGFIDKNQGLENYQLKLISSYIDQEIDTLSKKLIDDQENNKITNTTTVNNIVSFLNKEGYSFDYSKGLSLNDSVFSFTDKEGTAQSVDASKYLLETLGSDQEVKDGIKNIVNKQYNAALLKLYNSNGYANELTKKDIKQILEKEDETQFSDLGFDKNEIQESLRNTLKDMGSFQGTVQEYQNLKKVSEQINSLINNRKDNAAAFADLDFSDAIKTGEELEAITEMINDGTIIASNNIDILSNKLGKDLNNDLKTLLKSIQLVDNATVEAFAKGPSEEYEERLQIINKFLNGEEIAVEEWDKVSEFLNGGFIKTTDEDGKSIFKIDPMEKEETKKYFSELVLESSKIRPDLNENQIIEFYKMTDGSLKEVNRLHSQLQKNLSSESDKQKESIIYQQQYNQALKTTLDNLGVTVEEWNYLKSSIKGITDEDLIIRFKVDSNFDNQKKMFEAWQNTGFNVSDSNRFNLAASLAEDLDLSAQEVDSFLNSPEGQGILQKFYLGTPEERQAAWEELQAWYRERKILLDIELDYSKQDDQLSKILTQAKKAWENSNTILTFTAWIQLDDNKFKKEIEAALRNGQITEEQATEFWSALGVKASIEWGHGFGPPDAKGKSTPISYIKKITYEPIKSTTAPDGDDGGGGPTSTPAMYESRREDSSLRYKDTQNQISDLEKDADKLRKKLDLTWGPDSQNDLDLYKKKLDAIANTYQNLLTEANNYRESDRTNLEDTFNQLSNIIDLSGVQFNFDPETGLILNEQQVFDYIRERFNTVFAGQVSENTKDADKLLEALKQYFNDYQTAIKNSVEWAEKLEDTLNKQKAWNQFYKLQDEYNTELRMSNAELKDHDNYLKEINRKLTNQNKIISNSAGLRRLAEEDKYIDILHEESSALEKQIELKKAEQDLNKKYLENLLKANGITNETLGINEDQLIDQVAITTALRDSWETLIGILGTSEEVEKFANEVLNIVQKITEGTQSVEEITDKIEDLRLEEQAKNYEKLVEKLNNKLQKTKNELSLISYEFSKLSSNFYTMGEAAALFGEQGDAYLENLQSYADHYAQLNDSFKKGAISQKDFAEGLQQTFDGILENLNSIESLDQAVKSYYGQTLQAANDELNAHTAGLTRATTTLNHYLSVMQMINRKTDYASLGKVYEGLVKTTKNEYDVAVANYEMLKKQEEMAREDLKLYEDDKTSKSFEIANQKWKDAAAAMDQAYSDMLSKMEAWTQAIVDNFSNTMERLKQELENDLTDGAGFDYLIDHLQRLKSAEEEYLTRTNQIYELNKLAREAQKQMDDQVNSVSRQRISNFITETNALKDRTRFSNLELEIQKAKYELLLAEMAVEDARANKNKVRLQRDTEGGYGYVYTAEQSDVSDAVQKYEDAQNRLYNIGLENAEKYTEKSWQLYKEATEQIEQLYEQRNENIITSDEELHRQVEELWDHYYKQLTDAQELYSISLNETHEKVVEDSWTTQVEMTNIADKWATAMGKYIGDVDAAWDQYQKDLKYANDVVGASSEETAGKVKLVVDESNNLTTALMKKGGLIDAIGLELTAVANTVSAYAEWRKQIDYIIKDMENMANKIKDVLSAMNGTDIGADGNYIKDYSVEMFKTAQEIDQLKKIANGNPEAEKQLAEKMDYYNWLDDQREIKRTVNDMRGEYTEDEVTAIYQILRDLGYNDYIKQVAEGQLYLKDLMKDEQLASTIEFLLYDYIRKNAAQAATGGYTGEWADGSGKLAFLHQKELVLNAEDTQNILSAVGMVRQMDSLLEGFTFGQGLTPGTMQQQVTIHAEFPNVQGHNEIELAFNDLVNRASQYIMAK